MARFGQGSGQQISLMSLTDFNRSIWRSLNAGVSLRGPRRPVLTWDMHQLSNNIGTETGGGYKDVPIDSEFWHVLWPSNFTDDAGGGLVKQLPSIFAVNAFNMYGANANNYRATFNFAPLIGRPEPLPQWNETEQSDSGYNEIAEAERVLYELCTIPAYPVLVATTVPSHQTFGPLLLENASFSVSGDERPGPVEVSLNLTGGKSFRLETREKVDFEIVRQNPPPPDNDDQNDDENNNGISDEEEQNQEPIWEYRSYRQANLVDCLASFSRSTNVTEMRDTIQGEVLEDDEQPGRRLVHMSLSIDQQVTLRAPTPTPPRTDDHGPRYAQVEQFYVSGSLRFYSREKRLDIRSGALTLYFGGGFLFCMPAVDFAWPTLNLSTGKGYLHEVRFVARAPKNTVARAFLAGAEGLPVSQFSPLTEPQVG